MNEVEFPSSAEMAERNRVQYDLEYTEGISQQMRIPDRLKIGPGSSRDQHLFYAEEPQSAMMQVPERLVVAGDGSDAGFSVPRELGLIQSASAESVELKAPPRVLTLADQPPEFLEPERAPAPARIKEELHQRSRSKRERCASENAGARRYCQVIRYEGTSPSRGPLVRTCPPLSSPVDWPSISSAGGLLPYVQLTTRRAYEQVLTMLDPSHRRSTLTAVDVGLEMTPDDLVVCDASALRRQIVRLNRRLQVLEHENKERGRREMVVYSLTAALWLINAWMWVRR